MDKLKQPRSYESHEQLIERGLFERIKNEDGKWNLQNKKTKELVSEIWFDSLLMWGSFSAYRGEEHDNYGWDGLVFLEEKTPTRGAYPFVVNSKIYTYSSAGELLKTGEGKCRVY